METAAECDRVNLKKVTVPMQNALYSLNSWFCCLAVMQPGISSPCSSWSCHREGRAIPVATARLSILLPPSSPLTAALPIASWEVWSDFRDALSKPQGVPVNYVIRVWVWTSLNLACFHGKGLCSATGWVLWSQESETARYSQVLHDCHFGPVSLRTAPQGLICI